MLTCEAWVGQTLKVMFFMLSGALRPDLGRIFARERRFAQCPPGPRKAWGPPEFYLNIAGAVGNRCCSLLLMRATGLVSAALQSPEEPLPTLAVWFERTEPFPLPGSFSLLVKGLSGVVS